MSDFRDWNREPGFRARSCERRSSCGAIVWGLGVWLAGCPWLLVGCAEQAAVFNEVKHPHEILKSFEVNQYLRIVNRLPGQQLPPLPPLFAELPEWDLERELSVKGLVSEEQKRLRQRWFSDTVLAKLNGNRPLQKLLKQEGLTTRQFLGLVETINLAAARKYFPETDELSRMIRTGQFEMNDLLKREEVFSNLSREEQYELLRRAAWITRHDRAQCLVRVPDENLALLTRHFETVKPFLHSDALLHPFHDVVDRLQVYGIPFEETPEGGSDENLGWSADDPRARIGRASQKQLARQDSGHR